MPTSHYPQGRALVRALRFIWRSDDAFFYGLHRTEVLRQASFRGYWWPNRHVLLNWAYPYLMDVVLKGRVLLAPDASVQFLNHDYSQKSYGTGDRSFFRIPSRIWRRINVHYLYWEKCARVLSPLSMPLVVAMSLAALLRDGISIVLRRLTRIA